MDPTTLATTAVNFLVPYFAKAGEAVAKQAANLAWKKLETIYSLVRDKLAGDAYAEQTLKRAEEKPDSDSRISALKGVLEEHIKEDRAFAKSLEQMIDEAKEAGAEKIVQQISVSGQARTGDITTIGRVDGDVDLSKKR